MTAQPDHYPDADTHITEIGSDLAARVASASCLCGWAKVLTFTRPSGEPVALRLAQAEADRHEADPDADADAVPEGCQVLLVTNDVDVFGAVLAINLNPATTVLVYQDLGTAAASGAVQAADLVLLGPDAVPTAVVLRGLPHPRVAAITTRVGRHDEAMAEMAGCVRLVMLPRDAAWVAAGGREREPL